jgi:putative SOS response-associated peptidase YedK
MCRRYSFFSPFDSVNSKLNARPVDFFDWQPQFNAASGAWMPVITNEFTNVIQFFRWGLTPQWAKDTKMGLGMYNTRMEKLTEKPAFEKIYKYKRCIAVADGWYYLPTAKKIKEQPASSTALRVHLTGNMPLFFAGIWDVWGDGLNSFSIITRATIGEIATSFPEMPVLLNVDQVKIWLAKGTAGSAQANLLRQTALPPLQVYPVSTELLLQGVNDVSVLQPFKPPETQQGLF